ncbi:4564_t:CDS:2 [Gigaspora margarita]|uniref:4564_t:CDS:1 n=1 Tax=Gigaspora margarita TaxID=4874 RepID=A0ABN7VRB1_GIGMA|nr:4564_t:CDS:2 [Gigaspora margarita]
MNTVDNISNNEFKINEDIDSDGDRNNEDSEVIKKKKHKKSVIHYNKRRKSEFTSLFNGESIAHYKHNVGLFNIFIGNTKLIASFRSFVEFSSNKDMSSPFILSPTSSINFENSGSEASRTGC